MTLTIPQGASTVTEGWRLPAANAVTHSRGVAVSASIMWGNPTIPGTRIPVFRLNELRAFGYTPERIAHEVYGHRITAEQVRSALNLKRVSTSDVTT